MTTATTTRRRPVTASSPASTDVSDATATSSPAEGATEETGAALTASVETASPETGTTESGQVFQSEGTDTGAPAGGTPAASDDPTPEPETDEDVDARVLIAFDAYDVNDIITAPRSVIGELFRNGQVDPNPDAVAFALAQRD